MLVYSGHMESSSLTAFVQTFLDKMGQSPRSIGVASGHRTVVKVSLEDPAAFISQGGEALRALNTIAKRMVEHAHGAEAAAFLIDINEYHESQLERVRGEARALAQRARLFKHDVEMPPLSSYERLVVHELFAEDPEIKTESRGEGKFRHIVLRYKDSALAGGTDAKN